VVRGGRFVNGFVGEQYALPEAVELLRSVRRAPHDGELVTVSACDPLNLVGSIVPGRTNPLPARPQPPPPRRRARAVSSNNKNPDLSSSL